MAEEKINQNENIAKDEEGRVVTRNANILCVLRILEKYTDADHPLTQEQIAEKIAKEFNIKKPKRTTVGDNLKILGEKFGCNIGKVGGKGVYLASNTFDVLELKMLASSIATAKFLPAKQAKELLDKLNELSSKHNNLNKGVGLVDNYIRTNNRDLSYNLEVISRN